MEIILIYIYRPMVPIYNFLSYGQVIQIFIILFRNLNIYEYLSFQPAILNSIQWKSLGFIISTRNDFLLFYRSFGYASFQPIGNSILKRNLQSDNRYDNNIIGIYHQHKITDNGIRYHRWTDTYNNIYIAM